MNLIVRQRDTRAILKALENEIAPLMRKTHSPLEVATILNLSPQYVRQFLIDESISYINYVGWVNL